MMKRLILPLAVCMACGILTGCGAGGPAAESQPPAVSASQPSALPESAESVSAESKAEPPAQEKPEPVYGRQIADGVYKIEVSSSSSMFRIVDAQLTVANGDMSCVLTLSGTGYEKLYMGAGEEALADPEDNAIYFVENADGKYTYQVPVAALDQEIDCAAWSIKKEKWYDRTLVFQSASLPAQALKADGAPVPADGRYEIHVSLAGGSGRAKVASPAALAITDGRAVATVVWDSPYYDKMTVDGADYTPVNTEGNAVFEIPVALDQDLPVTARTTAMSQPHDIEYTLRFDSAAMKPLENQ